MFRIVLLAVFLIPSPSIAQEQAPHGNAAAEIRKLLDGLPVGTPAEYEKIPDIWRAAIAAGKRNTTQELLEILKLSLPKADEPLHDWQAVVIGGGIVNGLGLEGHWPRERIAELLKQQPELKPRWKRTIELSIQMAHDESVKSGTRYDALRILGAEPFEKAGTHLTKYLDSEDTQLQQGAVSGLADIKDKRSTTALINAFKDLNENNRKFAIDALLRTERRKDQLREAVNSGKIPETALTKEQHRRLDAESRIAR